MSFSSDAKTELCRIEHKQYCCLKAECYGLWIFSKCFTLKETAFITESGAVARRMAEFAAAATGASPEVCFAFSRRKKQAYRVELLDDISRKQLLECFGHTGLEPNLRINRGVFEEEGCVQAFVRGAFLCCGTVTDPHKEYHLEFSVPYQNLAIDLLTLLEEIQVFPLTPAISQRKGSWVVYLKDSAQIENFLTYLGASAAAMDLMQVKMYKEAKNNINRKTNFETANMDKTYSASAKQTAAIAVISDTIGIGALPEELQELAALRLEHPDMTLRQLGEALKISRSGVNHRLQRLLQIGEKLVKEKGLTNLMEGIGLVGDET